MLLPTWLDDRIKKWLGHRGYVLLRGEDSFAMERRRMLLASSGIDLVLDVGANEGQYGKAMRKLGYAGSIVSFEPMREAYAKLRREAERDTRWTALNYGLGNINEMRDLHISANSVSSSVLDMLAEHVAAAPRSKYVESERIELRRLDDVFEGVAGAAQSIWMKLDVQGFEAHVLAGAEAALRRLRLLQVELSFTPLYAQQSGYLEICRLLHDRGFDLVGLEPGFMERTSGRLLQADGIFMKRQRS